MKHAKIEQLFDGLGEVLTISEAAKAIRCSHTHLHKLIHLNVLPCYYVGKQIRVLTSDIIICFTKKPTSYRKLGSKGPTIQN